MMAETSDNNGDQPPRLFEGEKSLSEGNVYVSLTYDELDAKAMMNRVKSPKAGAVVLFAGTHLCPSPKHLTKLTQRTPG